MDVLPDVNMRKMDGAIAGEWHGFARFVVDVLHQKEFTFDIGHVEPERVTCEREVGAAELQVAADFQISSCDGPVAAETRFPVGVRQEVTSYHGTAENEMGAFIINGNV